MVSRIHINWTRSYVLKVECNSHHLTLTLRLLYPRLQPPHQLLGSTRYNSPFVVIKCTKSRVVFPAPTPCTATPVALQSSRSPPSNTHPHLHAISTTNPPLARRPLTDPPPRLAPVQSVGFKGSERIKGTFLESLVHAAVRVLLLLVLEIVEIHSWDCRRASTIPAGVPKLASIWKCAGEVLIPLRMETLYMHWLYCVVTICPTMEGVADTAPPMC